MLIIDLEYTILNDNWTMSKQSPIARICNPCPQRNKIERKSINLYYICFAPDGESVSLVITN